MNKLNLRSKRLSVVTLVVLVLAMAVFATGATAFAATATNSVTATIPAGGWAAYSFDFAGPGSSVAVTLNYNAVPGVSRLDKYLTMDVFQPADAYRDDIGSAHFVTEGELFYVLSSKMPSRGDRNRIENGDLDAPAPAGKYQLVVHNWNPDHAVTIRLSTANITKMVDEQKNQTNLNSRQNSGYFDFSTTGAPALAWVASSK